MLLFSWFDLSPSLQPVVFTRGDEKGDHEAEDEVIGESFTLSWQVDDHLACAVAGITADANILINYARLAAQRYTLTYQEPIPVEQLVVNVCDRKQGYTQVSFSLSSSSSQFRLIAKVLRAKDTTLTSTRGGWWLRFARGG